MRALICTLALCSICTNIAHGSDNGIGNGSFYQQERKADRGVQNNTTHRRASELTGALLVNDPITVEGTGRATIINGVRSLNTRSVTAANSAALITAKCPKRGHKVIVRGAFLLNTGRITAHSTGSNIAAAPLIIDCDTGWKKDIQISNTVVVNTGTIRALSE